MIVLLLWNENFWWKQWYIRQLLYVLKALQKCLNKTPSTVTNTSPKDSKGNPPVQRSADTTLTDVREAPESVIMTLNDFLFETNFDNFNLFKIEKYMKRSEIVKKVKHEYTYKHTYTRALIATTIFS